MTRREFTIAITTLLKEMIDAGDQPIIDFVKRTDHEQAYLFAQGLSKCDGIDKISKHQVAKAMDIYLCHNDDKGNIVVDFDWNKEKSDKWHKRWIELGGRGLIVFLDGTEDNGHFEEA
jgi:hypothetical protein